MNILQVCAYAAPYEGNFIKSLMKLDEELAKRGHQTIYAFCEYAKDQPWCKELQKHKKVYFLPQRHARIKLNTYISLRKILKQEDVSIVHSHFELYDLPLGVVAPKKCKQFWHLHDDVSTGYQQQPFYKKVLCKLHYKTFSKKAVLCSVSKKHMEFVCDLGFRKEQALYIPNGTDFSRLSVNSQITPESDFLIFSWDFIRKGGDIAIKAAKRLYNDGYHFKVAFVGNDTLWTNDEIKSVVNEPWFVRQEFVEDVSELYNATRCFLHISRAEGCSYALLEATYFGLPIICSDIDENQFLEGLPTIYYTSVGDDEAVYLEMKRLLNNRFEMDSMNVKRSKQTIVQNYSLDSWVQNMVNIYAKYIQL